jgi:prevent-host-death family protein
MGRHSVAEAKNQLSALIDRAIGGEAVVITRHGRAVVELRPVSVMGRPMTADDVAWLAQRRVGEKRRPRRRPDAAQLVRMLRDEGR